MTVAELKAKLVWEKFREHNYSLDGSTPKYADDAFILSKQKDFWLIEYIERGIRREEFRSEHEDEACREFYRLMDRSMR